MPTDSPTSTVNCPGCSKASTPAPRSCRARLAWIGVFLWAGTIFWFSSRSGEQISQMNFLDLWDKAAHFAAFAAGGPPMVLALRWTFGWAPRRLCWVSLIVLSFYGAADEIHQLTTPHRSGADPYDWMADTLGAVAGTLGTILIHVRTRKPHCPAPTGD